jgi:hypothetical protein
MNLVMVMRRSGLALAAAMLAIVTVGVLLTGAFYGANKETRALRDMELKTAAESIAAIGLEQSLAQLDRNILERFELHAAHRVANDVTVRDGVHAVGTYSVVVTRLSPVEFVVKSTGAASDPASVATYTIAKTIRLRNA